MKTFPTAINVKNKNSFSSYKYDEVIQSLRKSIYCHIIRYTYDSENKKDTYETENNSYELDMFFKSHGVITQDERYKLYLNIKSELNKLGWKCELAFGGTSLFIYSSEKLPTSCWVDGF